MEILSTLSNLEILSRSQIQALFNIRGVRNVNRIMQSLKRYTRSIFVGENAYYLNKRGVELTGARSQFRPSDQLTHKIMRNDAYIFFKPTKWAIEKEFDIRGNKIVCDAFFHDGKTYKFLEVDNEQRWHINVKKFESYSALKKAGNFRNFPPIIWIVKYDSRIPRLKELARKYEINCEIYAYGEIKL